MPVLYRLICRVYGREGPGVELKVRLMSQSSRESRCKWCNNQVHVIQVHKYCAKYETFLFALPAGNPFTQENERRAWTQLSARRVVGKIRTVAKSRNPCKESLFRFHSSAGFLYFYKIASMFRRLSPESFNRLQTRMVKTNFFSLFSFAYKWPVVIKHGMNTRLYNKTSCSRDCTVYISGWPLCHALLFSLYLWTWIQSSLLAPHHSQVKCTVSNFE